MNNNFAVTFVDSGVTLFTIKADGSIERGPGFTTDDKMSLKFWEAVENSRRPLPPLPKLDDPVARVNEKESIDGSWRTWDESYGGGCDSKGAVFEATLAAMGLVALIMLFALWKAGVLW